MTIITPNSIAGIVSITAQSGSLNFYTATGNSLPITSGNINIGTGASISSPATNVLALGTNNTEAIRIDSSGRIQHSNSYNTEWGAGFISHYSQPITNIYFRPSGQYTSSLGLTGNTNTTQFISIDSSYNQTSSVSAGIFLSAFHADAGGSACGFTLKNLRTDAAGLVFSSVFTGSNGSNANETERLRISSSGNVGISTANPSFPLEVRGGNTNVITAKVINGQYGAIQVLSEEGNDLTFGYARNSSNYGAQTTAGDFSIKTTAPRLHFPVGAGNANSVMILDSSGRVQMPYQPFVFVARSANVSFSSGSKIPYDSVLDSRNLTWNTSNNNFVVPVTGVYTFSIFIRLEITNASYIYSQIRSNGSVLYNSSVLYLQKPNTLNTFQTVGVTISVKLTQNDTVDVIGVWEGTSPATLQQQSLMSIVFNG